MPIRIPDMLPATGILESENIFVMTEHRALHQDIRPLRVLVLNLMPTTIETETQILRKLSNSPLQVNVDLLQMATANLSTQLEHMEDFYVTLSNIRTKRYDGMIVTGAPLGVTPLEEVPFWPEFCEVLEWAKGHVFSTLYLSWSAQAALNYLFGIKRYRLDTPLLGIYPHRVLKPSSPLVRGINDVTWAPRTQQCEVRAEDIAANMDLEIIAASEETGVYLAKSTNSRHFFVFGHPEYDFDTFAKQYRADLTTGKQPTLPANYFPGNDPSATPYSTWRSDASLLYSNWLNYYVYQATPYDLDSLRMTFDQGNGGKFFF